MTNEIEISATSRERSTRRRRRRKKEYTDATWGARLPHEDARIADEYRRQHNLDRADVVRLAIKQFAYRQQMRYQPKGELAELREQIFREHFAPVGEQLEALLSAFRELPHTLLELHAGRLFRTGGAGADGGELRPPGDIGKEELARRVEAELRSQRRVLERAHSASALTLRLVTNYLVEPQLRRIEASDAEAMKPHLHAAREGKDAWTADLSAVMRLTGERVMAESGYPIPVKSSGISDAAKDGTGNGVHAPAPALADADINQLL